MLLRQIGMCVLAAGTVAMGGCSDLGNPVRPKAEPILSATSLDFGTVAVSGTSVRTVTVANSGSAVLAGTAAVSCAGYQLIAGGGPFTIAPGGSLPITIKFSPSGLGSFPCFLDLGPDVPQVSLTGSGAAQAPGALSFVAPDSIDFGVAAVGQVKTGAFQVFSIGTAPLLVNIASSNPEYSIVSGGGLAEIPVGGFINVLVEFRPQGGKDRPGIIAVGPECPDVITKGYGTTVSYKNDIRAIFDARCDQACHVHPFKDPATAYSNLTNIFFGYIVPYDLEFSSLYQRVATGNMPQGGPPLSQEEVNKFRDWILEGALDN